MLASGSGHSGGPWQDSVHIRGRTRKPDSAPEKFGSVVSRFHKKKKPRQSSKMMDSG